MIKVYAIEERQDVHEIEDNEFIEIAKEQGTTWELSDFQNFINWEGSPPFFKESENLCFRFIDVPTESEKLYDFKIKNELSHLKWLREFSSYISDKWNDAYNDASKFADSNCDRCDGSGESRSQDLQSDICSDCDGSGKKSDDDNDKCSECGCLEDYDNALHTDVFGDVVCDECGIKSHCFCEECSEYVPTSHCSAYDYIDDVDGIKVETTQTLCNVCIENKIPNEIISIKNGTFCSSIEDDWSGEFPNISKYWVNELNHLFQGCNCDNIDDYKVFSYLTYAYDLMDNYRFEDSAFHNNLVPSMNYDVDRYENGINYRATYWVGFPNSNDRDEENEEWNYFTINFEDDITKEYFSSMENDIVFETIEDVLGFIESNKNENGGLI